MDQKAITRLAVIRAVNYMFEGVQDDDHALFTFETLAEYPNNQLVQAIDVAGAKVQWLFTGYTMESFISSIQARIDLNARDIELNLLVNQM